MSRAAPHTSSARDSCVSTSPSSVCAVNMSTSGQILLRGLPRQPSWFLPRRCVHSIDRKDKLKAKLHLFHSPILFVFQDSVRKYAQCAASACISMGSQKSELKSMAVRRYLSLISKPLLSSAAHKPTRQAHPKSQNGEQESKHTLLGHCILGTGWGIDSRSKPAN
jgi:hypothetical protein